jgi:hypothetical protein
MRKPELTDEQIEMEIERLWQTDEVKLAKKEQNIKYKRRQYYYQLRAMEQRGAELMEQGIDFDNIEERLFAKNPSRMSEV